jgi:uncharacterized membrane protein required for colicin V production
MTQNSNSAHPRRDWTPIYIVVLALGGGYAIGHTTDDWIVAALVMFGGIAASSGYRAGAIVVGALIGGGAVAIHLAPTYAHLAEPMLQAQFGLTGLLSRGAAIAVVGIGISLAALLFGCILRAVCIPRTGRANKTDRLLGAVFGACEGIAVATLLLCGAMFLEPFARQQIQDSPAVETNTVARRVSEAVVSVAEQTGHSRVAPLAAKIDPIQKSQWGRTMRDIVVVVGNPDAMQKFLEHPKFETLLDKPELQTAADQIANDPHVRQILEEAGGVNRDSLAKLLASPRLIELLDETGVASQFAGMANELQPALQDAANQARSQSEAVSSSSR